MKMKQLIKIINVITNRATPYDICELLEEEYFSNSRQENIKYGDMKSMTPELQRYSFLNTYFVFEKVE